MIVSAMRGLPSLSPLASMRRDHGIEVAETVAVAAAIAVTIDAAAAVGWLYRGVVDAIVAVATSVIPVGPSRAAHAGLHRGQR